MLYYDKSIKKGSMDKIQKIHLSAYLDDFHWEYPTSGIRNDISRNLSDKLLEHFYDALPDVPELINSALKDLDCDYE